MERKLNMFDICFVEKQGRKYECTRIERIAVPSDRIKVAYAAAVERYPDLVAGKHYFVYPATILEDESTAYALADYAAGKFFRFGLANDFAANAAISRTADQREEDRQNAALAVLENLANGGNSFTAYRAAKAYLERTYYHLRKSRGKEKAINPDWKNNGAFVDHTPRETVRGLHWLIEDALELSGITEKQRTALVAHMGGYELSDILAALDISLNVYYRHLRLAKYHVYTMAYALEVVERCGGVYADSIFAEYGYPEELARAALDRLAAAVEKDRNTTRAARKRRAEK